MFTGLVQQLGRVESRVPSDSGEALWISLEGWGHRPEPGASIAVAGCCLTVADRRLDGDRIEAVRFDVVPQTLRRTTIGSLSEGDRVNLEPSATPETLLGGHLVQGHVDEVGKVLALPTDGEWRVRIGVGGSFAPLLVARGSIAVEGVSLTIAGLGHDWFEVALIPETLDRTTLRDLKVGDGVNLEGDCIAKMVVRVLETRLGSDLPGAIDAIRSTPASD